MNNLQRLKYSVQINPSRSEISGYTGDEEVSFLPMESVSENGEINPTLRKFGEVSKGYTYFRDNDVVMAKITPCFENGKGAVIHGLKNGFGFGTTEFIVMRPMDLDAKFLHYLVSSDRFRKDGENEMRGSAGQKRVPESFVANYWFHKPSINEQQFRVRKLDEKTQLINDAIAQKRKLIDQLKEKRTALIHRAVTRGLDENVELVESGIEWIGKIPANWQVQKMKSLGRFVSGGTPDTSNLDYWNGAIPWVSPKDMKCEVILSTEDLITESGLSNTAGVLVPPGSLLIVYRSGILKHSLPTAISGVDVAVNQDIKVLIPKIGISARYLHYFIKGNVVNLLNAWRKLGATVESLDHASVANFQIPVPSLKEQELIIKYLEDKLGVVDLAIEKINLSCDLLYEYRKSLVTNLVTK